MFWAYNATSPQIDIILCKEDLTLQELLDQENVLQELKAQNLKLIEFLIKPEILRELVVLITTEPSSDTDIAEQYKYPNLACELLTSDLPALNERLASEDILNRLYQFLESDAPLNPLLSSYFSRTLSILISRKSEQNWFSYQYTCLQALEFLKAKEKFIQLLLKHIGTSSIMDLMHNLVTLIEGPELKQSLWNWLESQNVIPSLINLLSSKSSADRQANAASVLCSIIQKLRENSADLNDKSENDPILNLLESTRITELLLKTIFSCDELCDTSIESGIDVLLTIMQPVLPGDAQCRQSLNYSVHDRMDSGITMQRNVAKINGNVVDSEETGSIQTKTSSEIIRALLPYINKMRVILSNSVMAKPMKKTSGIFRPPLGKARLLVAKFLSVLISLNSSEIINEVKNCDIPELLLDLFYAYSSNNFLHTEVEKFIAHSLDQARGHVTKERSNGLLIDHLLKNCQLLTKILNIWNENEEKERSGESRKGYMGHLIRISTLIHIEAESNPFFMQLLKNNVSSEVVHEWKTFVEEILKPTIVLHSSCLGGIRPSICQNNDTTYEETISSKEMKSSWNNFEGDNGQNVVFSNDSTLFDYDDENYGRLSTDLTEEEENRQAEMFNMVCAQKWQSYTKGLDCLGANEDGESDSKLTWLSNKDESAYYYMDSDDENVEENPSNTSDPWSKLGNVSDPWSTSSENSNNSENNSWNSSSDSNWANFEETFDESSKADDDRSESSRNSNDTVVELNYFSSSTPEKSDLLNCFFNVKISSDSPKQEKVEHNHSLSMDENWPSESMSENVDSSSDGNSLSGNYSCFPDQVESDEMLNLESISGNTLAEKIANAENDIRNKDEIRLREKQVIQTLRLNETFDKRMDENGTGDTSESDVQVDSNDEYNLSSDMKSNEQATLHVLQQDCITENSYDFVTAENSISDAESSNEFADAENSFEFEGDEEFGEVNEDLGSDSSTCLENIICSDGDKLSDAHASSSVGQSSDECNNIQIRKSLHIVNNVEKTDTLNSDVPESVEVNDCDKSNDPCNSCNSSRAELDKNVNNCVIEEPA